jgi:opacity protein-like surface antigen
MNLSSLRTGSLLLATLGLALPATALADSSVDGSVDKRAEARDGVMVSVGLGAGRLGCATDDGDDCDGDGTIQAGGFTAEAGLMLSPQLALVGHISGAANRDDDVELSQWVAAVAVRGWLLPQLWIEGGGGVARAKVSFMSDIIDLSSETDTVPALVGGIGAEVVSTPKLAVDVALRGAAGAYEDDLNVYQVTLGAGVTFF